MGSRAPGNTHEIVTAADIRIRRRFFCLAQIVHPILSQFQVVVARQSASSGKSQTSSDLMRQFQIWFGDKPPSRPPPASADALQGEEPIALPICAADGRLPPPNTSAASIGGGAGWGKREVGRGEIASFPLTDSKFGIAGPDATRPRLVASASHYASRPRMRQPNARPPGMVAGRAGS